jgi:hypothetical protein
VASLHLNVSHSNPDSVLTRSLDNIDDTNDHRVSAKGSSTAIKTLLEARLPATTTPAPPIALDLIAHSDGGVLQLGDWSVDGGQASQDLARELREANIVLSRLRLLGCVTAGTEDGKAAITDLARIFNTTVWGTTIPIGSKDFNVRGFTRTTALVDSDYLSQLGPDPIAPTRQQWEVLINLRRKTWLGDIPGTAPRPISFLDAVETIRKETEENANRDLELAPKRWPVRNLSAQDFGKIFSYCEPDVAPDPGLLVVPDFEVRVESVGFSQRHVKRAIFLLDGSFVRFFPVGYPEGLVARIRPEVDDILRLKAFGSVAAPRRLWPPPPR